MSSEEQLLADMANRCAEFFKHLSQFCRGYVKTYNDKMAAERKSDKKKKEKNAVDPNLPRKPLTAYLLYFQEKKPQFVEKYPDLTLSALTKLIAKQWNELTPEEKKPYLDRAENDRQRYENELEIYKERNKSNALKIKDGKDIKESKDGKEAKEAKEAPKESKEGKESKEPKDSKEIKQAKQPKESKKKQKKEKKPVRIDLDSEANAQKQEENDK